MQKIYETDPWLMPYKDAIDARHEHIWQTLKHIAGNGKLKDAVNNHMFYGLHKCEDGSWVFREYAPNANKIFLIGDFNNWKRTDGYALRPIGGGNWELKLPALFLKHGELYKLYIEWPGGGGERLPSYATRVVQDEVTKVFSAQVWDPEKKYVWKHEHAGKRPNPFIYECHIGMASEKEKVGSFEEFRKDVLPRVKKLGYDTLQIMALQEHPYYGSFGYQVSNFFALSSRFGTPEEFKALVDDAHGKGIAVIMDIVHSHSVKNSLEGLANFDGTDYLYFHSGPKGDHPAWGSRCFDYGKDATRYFLLSNVKYWMEEYHIDGFRFDGVTSMLYWDHGLGKDFGNYSLYFDGGVDEDAVIYLALANMLVKEMSPTGFCIAEDMSGMAGLAAPFQWSMGEVWWELSNKRADEKTISYAECHDQALVGDKTIIFRLMDKEMYYCMNKGSQNDIVDRGIALHKMIRLVTAGTAGNGYLNFMGNEFGHPEWIDFPREGNGWSFKYARRQWSLSDNPDLRYGMLNQFDRDMVHLFRKENLLAQRPELLVADEEKKILIFKRKNCIFALNFSPTGSFVDYGFSAPAGDYVNVLDSDQSVYNGFGRLQLGERHTALPERCPNGNQAYDHTLKVYLPARTALVLKQE